VTVTNGRVIIGPPSITHGLVCPVALPHAAQEVQELEGCAFDQDFDVFIIKLMRGMVILRQKK